VLYAAQNDVKFQQTNAAKVSVKPFQRLAGSKGRALGIFFENYIEIKKYERFNENY